MSASFGTLLINCGLFQENWSSWDCYKLRNSWIILTENWTYEINSQFAGENLHHGRIFKDPLSLPHYTALTPPLAILLQGPLFTSLFYKLHNHSRPSRIFFEELKKKLFDAYSKYSFKDLNLPSLSPYSSKSLTIPVFIANHINWNTKQFLDKFH